MSDVASHGRRLHHHGLAGAQWQGRHLDPDVTKERVFEASRALGYRANTVARSLRQQSSDTIGLISDTIASTPFAA